MSYWDYVKLYTVNIPNTRNKGKFIKRGVKHNNWLQSLKINDKIDIFDEKNDECWHIGTIIQIEKIDNKYIKLLIHYDGWPNFDEWRKIDYTQQQTRKLRKLHTFTPYHDYLINPSSAICGWNKQYSSKWRRCSDCKKKCCTQCFISIVNKSDPLQCKQCMEQINYQNILNLILIYSSFMNDDHIIDINLIYLITNYSMGILVKCSNTKSQCSNIICFESRFKLEQNLSINNKPNPEYHYKPKSKIYQYCPKYIHKGTTTIYGKNRRIFCVECSSRNIKNCAHCQLKKEVITGPGSKTICHNHVIKCSKCFKMYVISKIMSCQVCKKYICYDCTEYVKCDQCRNQICNDCIIKYVMTKNGISYGYIYCINCLSKHIMKCGECGDEISRMYGVKCIECDGFICDYDKVKHFKMCNICGDNGVCSKYHECPMLNNWTIYDDECDDYTLDDEFIKKYCYNARAYKRERKLNGFEKMKDLTKYHERKDNKNKQRINMMIIQ